MPHAYHTPVPRRALSTGLALWMSLPIAAQADTYADIGFRGAQASLGYIAQDGEQITTATGTLDYAITRHHGLQLDLGTTSFSDHWQGTLGAHLYMQPSSQAKYGLFAAYTDLNNDGTAVGSVGIEGLWDLTPDTRLSMRAGVGIWTKGHRDFIFTDFGLSHALNDRLTLHSGLSVYDIQEPDYLSRDVNVTFGAAWAFETVPVEARLAATYSFVTDSAGHDDAPGLSATLTWHPGHPGNTRAKTARPSLRPLKDARFDAIRPLTGAFLREID